MEEEKKLYPFRFSPVEDSYEWGSETFRLADLGYRDTFLKEGWLAGNQMSEVMDMYMDRVVGENVFEYYGRQFPFQVKTIKVNGRMPLRVSPDDETAQQRYDLLGKEKLWYISSAEEGARLLLGFFRESDAGELCARCADNSIDSILNRVDVKAGDWFHIPPGTVHAAEGRMSIVEVSESSPLDFCLCTWGKEMSTEEFDESLTAMDALDFINYAPTAPACHLGTSKDMITRLIQLPQFTTSRIRLSQPVRIGSEQMDCCIAYTCISGAAVVQTKIEGIGEASYAMKDGETILVPAETTEFTVAPTGIGTVVLETLLDRREDSDPYIDRK